MASLAAAVLTLLAALAGTAAGSAAGAAGAMQPTAPTGWVRLAHLSPAAPAVDVYLAPFGLPEEAVIRKAPYGAVSPYSSLPPGVYTVSMRPAGAAPDAPVALSQVVDVRPGTAYSLLVFETGAQESLEGHLVTDDLTAPPPGTGRIRLVQGAAAQPPITVDAVGGPQLARDAGYGTTTPYIDLPAGRWTLQMHAGGATVPAVVDVQRGSVTTALVTTTVDGALKLTPVADSTATGAIPVGGVEAGAGATAQPTADAGSTPTAPMPLIAPAGPAARPVGLSIPAIGVEESTLVPLGLTPAGALEVPVDFARAGWFVDGPVPGSAGPAVIAGHVDSRDGPAVFSRLQELRPGDAVDVRRSDGTTARFVVDGVQRHPKDAFPTAAVYGPVPGSALRLVTCGGAFDAARSSYRDNVVVFASPR